MASNKRLNAIITIGGAISSGLKSALSSTQSGIKGIGDTVRDLDRRQRLLGKSIDVFRRAGKDVSGLQSKYASLIQETDRLRRAQERLTNAQERYHKLTGIAGKAAIGGAAMTGAGIGMAVPLFKGVKEAKSYETEQARVRSLGLGDAVSNQAFKFSKEMKTYGTSQLENLTLVRDALSVFGDIHHAEMAAPTLAKMKFGNAAFYGNEHGADNEAKFMDMLKVIELRGGTKSQVDFEKQANMVQKVISATGGRVGPSEWRNMISTGGLAAKGTRDDAFYYQMEPLVQEMGGDKVGTGMSAAYSSLYQGRTTKRAAINLDKLGLIGDHSKVKNDKVGQVSHIDPGALLGSEIFRQSQYEWMKQVLLPTLAKKGLTSKDQVLDAIGSIFSNKKGGDLFGAMFLQQQQIDKSEHMNRGAFDIDQINKEGQGTAGGKEIAAEKKLEDLKLRMGTDILPLYTRGLEFATGALERLNSFIDNNPKTAKVMLIGMTALAGALVTVGSALATVGTGIVAFAGYGLILAKFNAAAGTNISVLRGIAVAARFAGTSFMWLGRAIFMNPIGLAVAAVAGAAFLIYENWGKLKPWFKTLWADITATFTTAVTWIEEKLTWIGDTWGKIKLNFGFGGDAPKPGGALNPDAPKPGDGPNSGAPPRTAPPMARPAGAAGPVVHNNSQTTINVHQQPGESSAALVDRIERKRRASDAANQRSLLFDPAMGS